MPHPLETAAGIARAARLTLDRPPRLGGTRLVAVDGPSGSGKTSLATPLAAAIARACSGRVIRPRRTAGGSTVPPAATAGRGAAPARRPPPGGGSGASAEPLVAVVSTDLLATWEHPLDWWPVLDECLLAPLAAGRTATLPVIGWISGTPRPGGTVTVPPVDVLVLEGVSSGRRAATGRITTLVWIEIADAATRLERAVARDGESMRRYLARWQRTEAAHFAADATRDRADVVIAP